MMLQSFYPGLKWALVISVLAYGLLWLIPQSRKSLDRLSSSFMIFLLTNRFLYGLSHWSSVLETPSALIQGRAPYWVLLFSGLLGVFWYYIGLKKDKNLKKWLPAVYLALFFCLLFTAGIIKRNSISEEIPQSASLESLRLEKYKGKMVILNFWASWCPPCKAEMPDFQRFYETYGEEVQIIAVNMSHTEKSLYDGQAYMVDHGYTFPMVLDPDGKISGAFDIKSIPTTLILNKDGVLWIRREETLSYDFLESLVK